MNPVKLGAGARATQSEAGKFFFGGGETGPPGLPRTAYVLISNTILSMGSMSFFNLFNHIMFIIVFLFK